MKRKGKIWVFVAAIAIILLSVTTLFGVSTQYGDINTPIIKSVSEIRFGIDIRGGVDVAFVPADGTEATETQLAAAQAVIEQRLIANGITDYEIYKNVSKSRIILRYPWKVGETEFNPETAIQELAAEALLTFREGNERDSTTGEPTGVTAENIILQGSDVASATARYGNAGGTTNQNYVELTLTAEGQAKFAEATGRLAESNGRISIWLDNDMISAPTVNEKIDSDSAVITGGTDATAEWAQSLADTINAGSLPFALKADKVSTISPTLGSQALRAMVIAGVIALILVFAFMVVFYRLPGFFAGVSVIGQTMGTLALISGYFVVFNSFTLTLPGIAGIILAIGIGVDANVIAFERIKEELRSGKKLDAGIKAGFQRGLAPVIDGNVTVLIVAIILMGAFGPTDGFFAKLLTPIFFAFGPSTAGNIYSFGYTLLVGVLLNFVFGVFGTRVMVTSISKFKAFRKPWLYGGFKEGQTETESKPLGIVKGRKKSFIFSGALFAVIIAASFILGVQMDVQFRGGAFIRYSYTGEFDTAGGQAVIDGVLGGSNTLQVGGGTSGSGGENTLTITLPGDQTVELETMQALTSALNEQYPQNQFQQLEVESVDATIGQEFLLKCIVALVAASLLILLYIAFRFRRIGGVRGGATAIVALLHDLLVVYGVFVLMRIPLNGNFIAVLLTILGYSINGTVVIYDRVRENRTLYGRRTPFSEIVNLSINQSLTRSINTTLTTLIALGCVCIFGFVYGLSSIVTFALPLMVGMISGVYSSLCIAGPLWALWEEKRNPKNKNGAKKPEKAAAEKA